MQYVGLVWPDREIPRKLGSYRLNLGDKKTMNYDVLIIGAGPGGIFSAYELSHIHPGLKIAVFECGNPLSQRKCPIDGKK